MDGRASIAQTGRKNNRKREIRRKFCQALDGKTVFVYNENKREQMFFFRLFMKREAGEGRQHGIGGAGIYRQRLKELLRQRGVPCPASEPADGAAAGGGREPHGQDHLPGREPGAEGHRRAQPPAPVRGQGKNPPLRSRHPYQGGLHHRPAAHGGIHPGQRPDLRNLSAICFRRRHSRLFHRRGIHRRHALPAPVSGRSPTAGRVPGASAGHDHHPTKRTTSCCSGPTAR